MAWMIEKFKPYVDAHYPTLPMREATFIGGSSMGGLMSLYALLAHNDTFSRAAALSPSAWLCASRMNRLIREAEVAPDTVLYMDYGSREMANHPGMLRTFSQTTARLMEKGAAGQQPHRTQRRPLRGLLGRTTALPDADAAVRTGIRRYVPLETQYFKQYSPALGRDMEVKVYGHAGSPCCSFPARTGDSLTSKISI